MGGAVKLPYTFDPADIGMVVLPLDEEAVMKEFLDKTEAKCITCGSSFEYRRGEGLACPFCGADFHTAYFSRNKHSVLFEGQKQGKQ